MRAGKIKTAGNAGGLNNHLERKMEVPNADPDLTHLNKRHIGSGDLAKDISDRLAVANITPRKNAVLAVEYLMAFSPEMMALKKVENKEGGYGLTGSPEQIAKWKEFQKNSLGWLEKQHGKENIVNFTMHVDEKTPHIHAVIVPVDEKGKLNCRAFLGGREKLREMQDSFAKVHEGIGLKRGLAGSKAHHEEVKKFYAHLPELNTSPSELRKQAEVGKLALSEKKALEAANEVLEARNKQFANITAKLVNGSLSPEDFKKSMVEASKAQEQLKAEKQAQELSKKQSPQKKPNYGMGM